jgi:hypothetical protein
MKSEAQSGRFSILVPSAKNVDFAAPKEVRWVFCAFDFSKRRNVASTGLFLPIITQPSCWE